MKICSHCGKEIEKGESYFSFADNFCWLSISTRRKTTLSVLRSALAIRKSYADRNRE